MTFHSCVWSLLLFTGGAAWACPPLSASDAAALPLAAVLARVPACHPDVRAASIAAQGAAADAVTAAQGPNPQLTVGAGSFSRDGVGRGNLWNKTFDHQLRVDQVVERGDKPALRREGALAAREAAGADRAEALRLAGLEAAKVYVDLSAALRRQQEMAASVRLNDESLAALDRRVRAGDLAPLDQTRFALDAVRVQADLTQAEADAHGLRLQLAALIGAQELAEQLTPQPASVDAIVVPPESLPASEDGRPAVLAARARVDAAARALALARAQRTRDVSVGAQFSRYPVSPTNTAGTGNTVSLSVSVPLFVRHAYEGEIARATADLAAAEELLDRTRQAARSEMARALSDWRAAQQRHRLIAEQVLPAAEKVAVGAELAYRRGASGVLDVLDARRSRRAAQIELINAEAERLKSAIQLQATLLPLESAPQP